MLTQRIKFLEVYHETVQYQEDGAEGSRSRRDF